MSARDTALLLARQARRETRGGAGRLLFFAACLALGVAAVVAVAGLSESIESTLRAEGRRLLASDVAVRQERPFPPALGEAAARIAGARVLLVRETVSMVSAAPAAAADGASAASAVCELKVVGRGYPFYGSLTLEPAGPLDALLDDGSVVVGPELLARLHVAVGGTVSLGGKPFRVAGVVRAEGSRMTRAFALGPRVFLTDAGFERAGLGGFGSRVEQHLLVALPAGADAAAIEAAAATLRAAVKETDGAEVQTSTNPVPELRQGLARVGRLLGLVALVALLVGAIGVSQTVGAWLAGRMDAIAVLKCLGVRPREIVLLYAGQTLALALLGSVLGAALGAAVLALLPSFVGPLLPRELVHAWQPVAFARGIALGTGVALLFSLPPLLGVRRVPAVRVIRRTAEPVVAGRGARVFVLLLLAGGVAAAAALQAGSWRDGALFAAGLAAAAALLALGALALVRAAAWTRGRAPFWLRHGLGALRRPGAGTIGAVVALGLGVLVVLAIELVHRRVADALTGELPRGAPTAFFVDVQTDQWEPLRTLLEREGATSIDAAPIVTARLTAIDGRPVGERPAPPAGDAPGDGARRREWASRREQRLTYRDTLPPHNTLVEGTLWSDPAHLEASLEEGYAKALGVARGATLTFDVQGVPLDLLVTSLRKVEWRSFGINFFVLAEPEALRDAPQFRVAAARVPADREQAVQDRIAQTLPNVVMVRIRAILDQVVSLGERIASAVQLLGLFTVLSGVVILAGSVAARAVRRGREVALLKTLGMTRRGVVGVLAVEQALVGALAGLVGAGGALVLAHVVLTRMELPGRVGLLPAAGAVVVTAACAAAAATLASVRALTRKPIEVLRDEG